MKIARLSTNGAYFVRNTCFARDNVPSLNLMTALIIYFVHSELLKLLKEAHKVNPSILGPRLPMCAMCRGGDYEERELMGKRSH